FFYQAEDGIRASHVTGVQTCALPISESQLPTVRRLAADLAVTRLTVQNAYAELQSSGWIESTVGRGTFVSRDARPQIMRHSPDRDRKSVVEGTAGAHLGWVVGAKSDG